MIKETFFQKFNAPTSCSNVHVYKLYYFLPIDWLFLHNGDAKYFSSIIMTSKVSLSVHIYRSVYWSVYGSVCPSVYRSSVSFPAECVRLVLCVRPCSYKWVSTLARKGVATDGMICTDSNFIRAVATPKQRLRHYARPSCQFVRPSGYRDQSLCRYTKVLYWSNRERVVGWGVSMLRPGLGFLSSPFILSDGRWLWKPLRGRRYGT